MFRIHPRREHGKVTKRARKSLPIDKLEFKKIRYDTPSDRRKLVKTGNEVRLNDKDMSFCEKLCVRLGNTNSAIFDILPDSFGKPSDKTEDVCSGFNVTNYEKVSTSEIITFESNSFLSMQEIIKSGNIDDLCPSSVVNELEIRTEDNMKIHYGIKLEKVE